MQLPSSFLRNLVLSAFLLVVFLPSRLSGTPNADSLALANAKLRDSISRIMMPPATPAPMKIKVTGWSVVGRSTNLKTAGLDDYIKVWGENLPMLFSQDGHRTDNIVLYINGIAMHGIEPLFENSKNDTAIFKLTRDSMTAPSWAVFYEYPRPKNGQPMVVSLGWEHDGPIDSDATDFKMIFENNTRLAIAWIVIILIIAIAVVLALKTPVLRDKVDTPPAVEGAEPPKPVPVNKRTYSLARTQIMFWTVVTAISFIFIWAVTFDIPEITGSTLILLMVSAGTTASARLVDSTQAAYPGRHQNQLSEGFFRDILSDENGICVHRLQMVIWTSIIGVYFLNYAYTYLYMPQIETNLLALMGISAGTYVGLKLPENKPAA